jgi:hypothetical protein
LIKASFPRVSALAAPPVYLAVYQQQHHLLAAVAFSGRRFLPPAYLAAAVGEPAAAPLNHCLADPQRLAAAVHPFLEAAEVGLLETTIFA